MLTDTASLKVSELIALPEVEVDGNKELEWAVSFWEGLYASRSEKAYLAYQEYDKAIDNEKSYAVIDELYKQYDFLACAAGEAGKMLDVAKTKLLAQRN